MQHGQPTSMIASGGVKPTAAEFADAKMVKSIAREEKRFLAEARRMRVEYEREIAKKESAARNRNDSDQKSNRKSKLPRSRSREQSAVKTITLPRMFDLTALGKHHRQRRLTRASQKESSSFESSSCSE